MTQAALRHEIATLYALWRDTRTNASARAHYSNQITALDAQLKRMRGDE